MPGCRVNRRKPLHVVLSERVRGTKAPKRSWHGYEGRHDTKRKKEILGNAGGPLGPVWNDQKVEKDQCGDTVKSISSY